MKIQNVKIEISRIACILFIFGGMFGCQSSPDIVIEKVKTPAKDAIIEEVVVPVEVVEEVVISPLEQAIIDMGLVPVPDSMTNVLADLKYATDDNFMGFNLYGTLSAAYLQEDVMKKLSKSSEFLAENYPDLNLLIYDAVRPRSVQQKMWDSLKMPIHEKVKFVSNPKYGSIHNFGCAVDLTLADSNGQALDMGAGYDDVRKIAYPRYEKKYVDSGMLSTQQIENRTLLRKVMRKGGFWGIQTEWWHFNAMSRDAARSKYKIVE
jgi:D-alanyl-D-alanine dipeptidase